MTAVSVEPETGHTLIEWDLSPSPDIAAYVLYTYNNGDGIPVDTLWDPAATSYVHITPAAGYFSVSYVVAAHRIPNCTSPLSNYLNTIFTVAAIDTCNNRITLTWNRYLSEPKLVTGYTIMASVNGGNYFPVTVLSEDKTSYILENFITDSEYCFIVKANLEDATFSESNKTCLSTEMQRPPGWINADYATVENNRISLSFTIDPLSDIFNFRLEKKSGSNGEYMEIAKPVSSDGVVLYTDEKADIKEINFYRLSAVNSCSNPVTVSNIASNIVLSLIRENNYINLKWNQYKDWLGLVNSYRILYNTGAGYSVISEVSASDSSLTVDYREIMYDISGGEVCFQVSAEETSNPYGIEGSSRSQPVCTTPSEVVTVPDVFTPNYDLINDSFRPVLSFTPIEYHLVITDRQGVILFETRDHKEAWDGSYRGAAVPQSVYIWYLKVTTPSRTGVSKTGTVSVYFNR
jgi:gliding motility-associated-like protein